MSGTSKQMMLGINKTVMMFTVEICPPIQSMVVVTSPIGVQAPPALAAITIMPAKKRRMSRLGINLRISDIMTIDVVRLSRIEERKNVTQQINQRRDLGFFVRMRSVMSLKPWYASTSSTM